MARGLGRGWAALRRWLGGSLGRPAGRPARRGRTAGTPVPAPADPGRAAAYRGRVQLAYSPHADGHADPGEVVWTWVPYEEDPRTGKDRPVLVVGTATDAPTGTLAVLPLTSRDRSGQPGWVALGPGRWDAQGRASSVRVDRVLAVAPGSVRREGAAVDRARFEQVVQALQAAPGSPRRS